MNPDDDRGLLTRYGAQECLDVCPMARLLRDQGDPPPHW
jgi:hypothetical protein